MHRPPCLSAVADLLMHSHLSPASHKAYAAAMKAFSSFCEQQNHRPFPVSVDIILNFIGHLYSLGISCSTAKVYLAGISHYSILQGGSPLLSDHRVHIALRGFSRLTAGHLDKRLPVSVDPLLFIQSWLPMMVSSYFDTKLYWCAFNLAFFGFLRVGELTCPNSRCTHETCLSLSSVEIQSDTLHLHLSKSKTDQFRAGADLIIPSSNTLPCPV